MTTLYWLTGLVFAALLPWGTNVPLQNRAALVRLFVVINILVHLVTATYMFEASSSPWASAETRIAVEKGAANYRHYLDVVALTPAKVHEQGGWRWAQLISANFVHAGWLHLAMNLWLFAIYGPNLENLFGRRRFALFLVGSMLGTQLAILHFTEWTNAYRLPHRGFSGVVYAVIGAYLVCFPRSRIRIALIYDFRFWAIIAFLLMPIVYILGSRSTPLAEMMLLVGVLAVFYLLQPEHARFGVPALVLLGYKLLQDVMTLQHQAESRVSIWGHLGGLAVGVAAGLVVNGTRGFKMTWPDAGEPPSLRRTEREKANLVKMEQAAHTDKEIARAYLGQRIFVGDAVRAVDFYINTAAKKYPELQLDARELHSLARMLETKAQPEAALEVYEKLARFIPVPQGFEDSLLSAARLIRQTKPTRAADALRYIKSYEEIAPMMRDRREARRLREEILEDAVARGEDTASLLNAADARPIPTDAYQSAHPSGYGGPGQPERRKGSRTASRMQQIESSDKYPALVTPGGEKDTGTEQQQMVESVAEASTWGKKKLPLKTMAGGQRTAQQGLPTPEIGEAHSVRNPPDVPDIPSSIEQIAGLKRPRIELTGLELAPLPIQDASDSSSEAAAGTKSLDFSYGPNPDNSGQPHQQLSVGQNSVPRGDEMSAEEGKHVSAPTLKSDSLDSKESTQREAAMKPGAEYAMPAFGAPGKEVTTPIKMYGAQKLATPSPETAAQETAQKKWLILNSEEFASPLPGGEAGDQLLAILSQELCRAVTADELLGGAGVLPVPAETDSRTLTRKLRNAGTNASVVARGPLAFEREPAEVLSMDMSDHDLVCNTVEQGRLRVPLSSILLLSLSTVRLSRRESAPARPLLEIVTGPPAERRLQLHERTFSIPNSKRNGEPLRTDNLQSLAELLAEVLGNDKYVVQDGDLSYQEHEALLRRITLLRSTPEGFPGL